MGLNHLLYRHQVSLMRADSATSTELRHDHLKLAKDYARRIEELVRPGRVSATPLVPVA